MPRIAPCPTDIGVVLPLALTKLYFDSLELWPSSQSHGIAYVCAFEDNPDKIAKMAPDILVSLGEMPNDGSDDSDRIYVNRQIVASPTLLAGLYVICPADLERLPYATLCRNDLKCLGLESSSGKVATVEPQRRFEGNDLFAAYEAAKQGIAYAVLPEWMVIDDIAQGKLIALLPDWTAQRKCIHIKISDESTNISQAHILIKLLIEKLKTIPGIEMCH